MTEQLHLGLNPVRSDRAEEFERFLAEVVVPAVRAQRPDLDGRWRVMRTSALIGDWTETVAPLDAWAEAAVTSGRDSNQLVWTLEPVVLA